MRSVRGQRNLPVQCKNCSHLRWRKRTRVTKVNQSQRRSGIRLMPVPPERLSPSEPSHSVLLPTWHNIDDEKLVGSLFGTWYHRSPIVLALRGKKHADLRQEPLLRGNSNQIFLLNVIRPAKLGVPKVCRTFNRPGLVTSEEPGAG